MVGRKVLKYVIIIITILIMAFAIYAIFTGLFLTQDETQELIEKGLIEKLS